MKTLSNILTGLKSEFTRWVNDRLTGVLEISINFNQGGVTSWFIKTSKQGED